jgi:hypothetical protein
MAERTALTVCVVASMCVLAGTRTATAQPTPVEDVLFQKKAILSFHDGTSALLVDEDSGLQPIFDNPALRTRLFKPGQRNVLVIHGFNSSPTDACTSELVRFIAPRYDNVLVYKYPSGAAVGPSAAWLDATLSPLLITEPGQPPILFDVVGYSEGGIVARAAKTHGGPSRYKENLEKLITVATPHVGLEPQAMLRVWGELLKGRDLPGVRDQLQARWGGSGFLEELNSATMLLPHGRTRYYALGGTTPDPDPVAIVGDGVVALTSAHGVLAEIDGSRTEIFPAERRTITAFHSIDTKRILGPSESAGPMPCSREVYDQLREWIDPSTERACADLSGLWTSTTPMTTLVCQYSLGGRTETITAGPTECSTTPFGRCPLSITQSACDVRMRFTDPFLYDLSTPTADPHTPGVVKERSLLSWFSRWGATIDPFTTSSMRIEGSRRDRRLTLYVTGDYVSSGRVCTIRDTLQFEWSEQYCSLADASATACQYRCPEGSTRNVPNPNPPSPASCPTRVLWGSPQ